MTTKPRTTRLLSVLTASAAMMVLASGIFAQDAKKPQSDKPKPAANLVVKPPPKPAPPALKPAVGAEAEEFTIESGWKIIKNGEGNYTVDIIGFGHIGNERVLSLPSDATSGSAYLDVNVPEDGPYTLWVRYEYPAFTEARFKAQIEQNGKVVAEKILGMKDSPKLHFNKPELVPQYDPPWGPEGIFEEPMDVPALSAGKARIRLLGVEQPQIPGVSANRNIDLVYLTRDTQPFFITDEKTGKPKPNPESWYVLGGGRGALYPILNAYRDSRGARWEARVVNKSKSPARGVSVRYQYNRIPWYVNDVAPAGTLEPGAATPWFPLHKQDTAHFGAMTVALTGGDKDEPALELELRPLGGEGKVFKFSDPKMVRVFVPPYATFGDEPVAINDRLKEIIAYLKATPPPGRDPKEPLAFGGWVPISPDSEYGRLYGELYKVSGFRAIPLTAPINEIKSIMELMGLPLNKSAQALAYRQPPSKENVAKVKEAFAKADMLPYLRYFDYGDEIHFAEWVNIAIGKAPIEPIWMDWLKTHRPDQKPEAYWLKGWGEFDATKLKPDSTAAAAAENPRLYVDSVEFYEDLAITWVSKHLKELKKELGEDVLGGANYAAHPFYYPPIAPYVTWFRRGAADYGRHSEYFWQIGQAGPMVNGYIMELFRCGMRKNPKGFIRQYTMPHAPGNTEPSFLRTAFTHLAHGANGLDYFGIGLNETFTENHIDHRFKERYRSMRDINYSMGMVDDVWSQSSILPSEAAILVSYATELWDVAPIATRMANHAMFAEGFRKMRLNYHMDRLGIWKATTFAGVTPDLVVEEDLTQQDLKGYKVLFVVGDALPLGKEKPLQEWVEAGGTLVATSGAGSYGTYREPNPGMQALLGIASRKLEERDTFMRPMQDLQFMRPIGKIVGDGFEFPVIGNKERITPTADAKVLAKFDDGSPAIIERKVGKGRVVFVAALPGVSYFWSALQPNIVADRADNVHRVPQNWDKGAATFFGSLLKSAQADPVFTASLPNIDGRLIKGPKTYILPVSNYSDKVNVPCEITLKVTEPIGDVVSSFNGKLTFKQEAGKVTIQVPKLGYGEMIRINLK
jgi:hypothetical protein